MSQEIKQLERMIDIISRMIPKERQAQEVYRNTASTVSLEMMKALLEHLYRQEKEHEEKLHAMLRLLQDDLARLRKGQRLPVRKAKSERG
ncbi:MAG: ferritin family protein [Planctomycetota bacterium]|jgi:rubrerythrin